MAKRSTQKSFCYKVAAFPASKSDKSLQQRLTEAYGRFPKPSKRTQRLKSDDAEAQAERVVIFYRTEHKGLSCGVLQRFRPGAPALATIQSDDADNYEIRMFAPPVDKKSKKRVEFAKTLMFFGVRDNHVIVSEGIGFGTSELESHLSWLCEKHSPDENGNDDSKVFLEDNIPPHYKGRRVSGVRRVTFKTEPTVIAAGSLHHTAELSNANHEANGRPQTQFWTLSDDPLIAALVELVRRHSPTASKEQLFKLEDAFRKGDLRGELALRFVTNKQVESSPLDQVAHTLRHIEGLPYELELARGEKLPSTQTKIVRKYAITINEDVPVPDTVFSRMAQMLDDLVKGGEIVPDPS